MTYLDMMMSCASSDTLGVANFWPRAQTALVTGASTDRRWSGIVSRTADKLEVAEGGIYEREGIVLASLGRQLDDSEDLARWCELVTSDAPYIVAMCRIRRQNRKSDAKPKTAAKKPAAAKPVSGEEPEF